MLVLTTFRRLLSQVLTDAEDIHTAVLATPSGNLVSYTSKREVQATKSEIRTIVGLACEIWDEEKEESVMAETDSGKFFVQTVRPSEPASTSQETPLLLLCLSASEGASWQEISGRTQALAKQLGTALGPYSANLFKDPPLPPTAGRPERTPRGR